MTFQSARSLVGFSQSKPASQQCFSLKKTSTSQPKSASAPTSEQAQYDQIKPLHGAHRHMHR